MANDTRSGWKIKENDSNSSKRRLIGHEGSTTSGFATTDSSGLRRSTRETSSRNQSWSSTSIMRKSERLEKRASANPPIKRKFERDEEQRMPGPSKKSEGSEKQRSLNSSRSKKSEKGLSSPDTKIKREKKGKQQIINARGRSRNEKQKPKPSHVILKKKRLDTCSHRALLSSQARISKGPDLGLKLKRKNKQSQGASCHIRAGSSKEDEEEDECSERRKEQEVGEFSHFSCKQENHHEENHEFESQDKSLVSETGNSSRQSSPDGAGLKEAEDNSKGMQVECSVREDFQRSELMESISEGRSLAGDTDTGGAKKVRTLKRKRNTIDISSDTPPKEASEEICSVTADAVSSSPSGGEVGNFIERCVVCSKRQRVDFDSCDQEFCSCNAKDIKELGAGDGTRLIEECHSVGRDDEIPFILRVEVDHNACVVCKLGGKLLCCDGKWCKRNFHISCLDPPLKNVPPGVWYCFLCVKKKIELGVHSVSEQIESIWDVRQVDVSEKEGMQRQKQYLVKYKDLAHVHNRWVPESQLLQEVPLLVAKFNRKSQYVRWKPEWTIPHRLLQKRLLMSPKERDEYKRKHGTDISDCYHEWLVKWSDLGYEHVTWEFETSSFLRSNEAIKLIGDYESRREKAKRASDPSRDDKVQQELKGSFLELSKLPGGCPPELDCHLTFVNKIRECWHKGQNSFLIYDQERFMKVILFILSLQSDVCRPSLIVSSALSVWETEFLHLAPSINVVVYNGNSDVRKCIRALEFYEESGCLMFQVLLSTPDAVIEDLEVLECLGWEALIVDECQHSRVSKYFEQMKRLSTDFRLLVASGQIKDSLAGYLNLLAFLDSGGEGASPDGLKVDSSDNIGKLKERLTQFVPFECKSESSKFVEYWVPVELSNIQLEHYCSTLLSKEMSLRSCSKNDSVEALRDILISARKCCDHPYLLEPSLQSLLTKGLPEVEYLDVGIKASGKLQLLDKILQEMKRCGSRTLILFQSFGGSTLGDILDDFLRQRFGPDSYERVDGLVSPKKKQAAINMFNSRERGRFVFLLENRACHPSIKLSSVDTIILFDSDWNPLNDLRGLQRIHIDSQLERLKVFRLYTSCTVEEKILSLAKQDVSLDSNIQNINRSVCQMLLIWGASYLFSKLDGFHGGNTSDSDLNILSNESFMNAVVEELLIQLPQNADNCKKNNCSFISKVNQSVSTYSRDIPLLGESEMQLSDEEPPHVFWTKLLQGRYPRWRYLSGSSHRRRKRVQYFDESPRKSDIEGDEAIKKRKKVANNAIDPISLKPWLEDKRKVLAGGKEGTSGAQAGNVSPSLPRSAVMSDTNHACSSPNEVSGGSDTHFVESEERRKLRDAQKSLHLLLKPEISKLCEILKLPGYIKVMAGRFLEYIMNNHHVNREPVAILQAFQISVCWTAAASFKHKIDHKESLAHVKQLLNFECKEEEVEFIFSKLWMLKKMFYRCMESSTELKSVEDSSPRIKYVSKILPCASSSQSVTSAQEELEGDIRDSCQSLNFPQYVLAKQVRSTDFDKTSWSQKNDFVNVSQFNRICVKRIKTLLQKQREEVQKFNKIRQKEKAKLEEELKSKLALIHTVHEHNSIRLVKIKMAEQDHAKKIEENNQHWEVLRKNLEALQLVARNREKQMEAHWLEQAKSWISVGLFSKLPLPVSGFRLEQMMACELGATQISGPPSEKSDPNITFPTKPGEVLPSVTETTPNKTTEASVPRCREGSGVDATLVTQPEREDGGTDATVSVQFNGDSNRIDTMLDMQPKREDDGMDASVVMQSNEDGNSLDATLDMLPNRGGDRVDFIGLDMLSNGDNNGLDGTVSMHSVRVEGIDATVFMQPHRNSKGMDSTYGMESRREDNAMDATASEREILAGDEQHNMADNSNSVDLCSFEPIQMDSHSLSLPHVTAAQNSLFPLDEVYRWPLSPPPPFIFPSFPC
ncbi:chromodomain-helicase-DNA-binding protein Mi-2 homolog [Macadamia integrifolia]|uniref:chromodomain-helicase-DNA-binding protein Mi-2 homolog n=1 Tax=Macadamia integrifolia TaxID=60698 RepID=UPI001C4FB430|nr:chromodomain-helicase-DNA-binding protein Mi-2 homolog [Macadamia integrifolia]